MHFCVCGVCIPLNLIVPFLLGLLHRLGFVEPALERARRALAWARRAGGGRREEEAQDAAPASAAATTARRRQPAPLDSRR